jgi:anti-sigma-K factor RskA
MSDRDHDLRREEIAAYLLDSLEPGEAADLERHLEGCVECRTEVEWLRPAIQVLPESVERVDAPPALRARLMSEVQADAKRAQAAAENAGAGGGEGSFLSRVFGGGSGRSWGLRPVAGLAVAALVVAVVAGYAIRGDRSGGDSTVIAGKAPNVTARVVSNGDSGTLHLANVREIPSDKVLEAWVQRGDKVVSAHSLFVPDSKGMATATIPDMHGVETVMVTAEPRGGSSQPTSEPIVSVAIPQ